MSSPSAITPRARPVMPAPLLRVTDGALTGTVLRVHEDAGTLGRRPHNAYELAEPTVSRVHAWLTREAGSVVVTDLGSTGGTTLNGAPTEGPVVLEHGDVVAFGAVPTVFEHPLRLVADEQDTAVLAVPETSAAPHLSPRQGQVLELIAQGLTNGEIGAELGVTERTVKAYAGEIYSRLDGQPGPGRRPGGRGGTVVSVRPSPPPTFPQPVHRPRRQGLP